LFPSIFYKYKKFFKRIAKLPKRRNREHGLGQRQILSRQPKSRHRLIFKVAHGRAQGNGKRENGSDEWWCGWADVSGDSGCSARGFQEVALKCTHFSA